jgi:hypothetical protein
MPVVMEVFFIVLAVIAGTGSVFFLFVIEPRRKIVTLHQNRVDYLVTAEHPRQCSLFEFTVAPGFVRSTWKRAIKPCADGSFARNFVGTAVVYATGQ